MRTKSLFALLLLFLLQVTPVLAQQQPLRTFRVTDFHQDAVDLTARNEQFKKTDDSGSLYAIIKVKSDLPDDDIQSFRFDFGMMNSFVEYHREDAELWIYVQKNARTVTIRRDGFTTVNKYDLRTTIEAGATYVMQLSVSAPQMYVQMVMFNVKPELAKAVIMVKPEREDAVEELFGIADETGGVAKSLPLGSYTYRIAAENFKPSEGRFILNNQDETHVEEVTLRSNAAMTTLQVDADADIYVDGVKRGTRTWMGSLKVGRHHVECRQEGHKSSSQAITIAENDTRTITLVPPTPITGTLSITSKPLGANIVIDTQNYGQTPKIIKNLLIGQHKVVVSMPNYKSQVKAFDIKEKQTTQLELTLLRGVDDSQTAELIAKSEAKDLEEATPIHPVYQKPTNFYLMAGMQFGTIVAGVNVTAGAYIGNFNVEGTFLLGLVGSGELYWMNSTNTLAIEYKPNIVGGKIGYGINLMKNCLRLTPQVGAHLVMVNTSKFDEGNAYLPDYNGSNPSSCWAFCGAAGLRADYAFSQHFGIYLAPEMDFSLKKSEIFEQVSDVSNEIKTWADGFNIRVGFRYSF